MKYYTPSRPPGHRGPRRELEHMLRALFSRISSFAVRTEQLRGRVASEPPSFHLLPQIDALVLDLRSAARESAALASQLGAPVDGKCAGAPRLARVRRKTANSFRAIKRLAGALFAECKAYGARLCALLRAARQTHDNACARVAYWLLRMLEKLVWQLRQYVGGTEDNIPLSAFPAPSDDR